MTTTANPWQTLQVNQHGQHIIVLTLNRPAVRNAINSVMMQELLHFWREIPRLYPELRCLILTGSGDKAFCAGADLKQRLNLSTAVWKQQHQVLQAAMRAMLECPIPILAAVNGAAFGGGLELALASDFIYAAENAVFAQSEVRLGIMPGAMGTQNLPRACGIRRAKELCFTAQSFTAAQAYQWGIVNQVYTSTELLPAAIHTAEQISANAPFALRQVKKALNASTHLDLYHGYTFEVEAYNQLLDTQDRVEGIRAFNEKREPDFRDE